MEQMTTFDTDKALFRKWRSIINRCYGKHRIPNIYERHNIGVNEEWTGENGSELRWKCTALAEMCEEMPRLAKEECGGELLRRAKQRNGTAPRGRVRK